MRTSGIARTHFCFWTLSCTDESARDVSRNARFSRIGAFIEHWSASGPRFAENLISVRRLSFLIERVGVRPKVGARNERSLRREQRTGM